MPSVLRFARAVAVAAALAALPAAAAPSAHLGAMPSSGLAPLVVGFDTTGTTAGAIAEHLLLVGNGDALALAGATMVTNYNYGLPGFYLAQTWLRDDGGLALSPPVAITVSRQSDGRLPPTATASVQATTDPATFAFGATVTPASGDPLAAAHWDFGDGSVDVTGDPMPFHGYAQPGAYQAMFVATTRAGLPLYARTVVLVRDANGAVPPSLLVTASPEDASPLTPVTVTARIEGVTPGSQVTSAVVGWPDVVDAAPTVTPTMAGVTVTSQHGVASPGVYAVPVAVQLAGLAAPLLTTIHVTVANIDGTAPSPVVLAAPSSVALVGEAYVPGVPGDTLLVAGAGPFAFGAAAPSPANFSVDSDGHVRWTPTHDELGDQRLAVRIVDALGNDTTRSWVVQVVSTSRGCALGGDAAPATDAWPLALVVAALALRRRRATA